MFAIQAPPFVFTMWFPSLTTVDLYADGHTLETFWRWNYFVLVKNLLISSMLPIVDFLFIDVNLLDFGVV